MRVIHVTPQGGLTFKSDGLLAEAETFVEPVQGLRYSSAICVSALGRVWLTDVGVRFFRVDGLDVHAELLRRGRSQQVQAVIKLAPSAFFPRALARERRPEDQPRSALRTFLARSQVEFFGRARCNNDEAWTTATPFAAMNWSYVHPLGKEDEGEDVPIPHLGLRLTGCPSSVKLRITGLAILDDDNNDNQDKRATRPLRSRSGIWAGTELTYTWGAPVSIMTTLRYSSRTNRGTCTLGKSFGPDASTYVEASWVQRFGRVTTSASAKVPFSMQFPPTLYFSVGTRV